MQIVPRVPAAVKEQVAAYEKTLFETEAAHRPAIERLARFERVLASHHSPATRAQLRERHRLRLAAHTPRVPIPPLPASARHARSLFARLGGVVHLDWRVIDERVVEGVTATPYAPVTIKTDAGLGVLTVLGERQNEFPGVDPAPGLDPRLPVRAKWPRRCSATSTRSPPEELKLKAFRGVRRARSSARKGSSTTTTATCAGARACSAWRSNAAGYPVPSKLAPTLPLAGHSLKLTLDLGLQQESEKALLEGIERARAAANRPCAGGVRGDRPAQRADARDRLLPELRPEQVRQTADAAPNTRNCIGSGSASGPLTDRAVNGTYPTGSTFKPITAMAALEAGVVTPTRRARRGPVHRRRRASSSATRGTPNSARSGSWRR